MSLTITEGLAEIKTIGKRLEKKRQAILQYIARDSRLRDPLESEGGTVEYIKRERQAMSDLESRIVAIRTAIQKSNLATSAIVNGETRMVSEWLTFRREVADGRKRFLQSLAGGIAATRDKVQKEGGRVTTAGIVNVSAVASVDSTKSFEVLVSIEEKGLLDEIESLEKTLGDLDGKLSLLNATTAIDVQ